MTIKILYHKRIILLAFIIIAAYLIVNSEALYNKSEEIIIFSENIISQFPFFGMLVFVLLAIISAMLAFYSSAILVPIGIYTWGTTVCFLLLLIGWLLGGILTFTIGYYLGRPVTSKLIGEKHYSIFEEQFRKHTKFISVLLFQAAVPSEIPGYVLGTLRYRFLFYLVALGITEIPYALGTVYLGSSYLERNNMAIIILGLGAVLMSVYFYSLYRKYFHKN